MNTFVCFGLYLYRPIVNEMLMIMEINKLPNPFPQSAVFYLYDFIKQ